MLGILMLRTRFPRPPGDIGNPATWAFPVSYRVINQATADTVVRNNPAALLPAFIAAANELVDQGALGIATSCGFLSLFQQQLERAIAVPVATSALLQIPALQRQLAPGKRVGVITVSAEHLTTEHLRAASAPGDTPVVGIDQYGGRELSRVLLNDELMLDMDKARLDMLDAGKALVARYPDVGAVVLECTNMPPYSDALRQALGIPVYDTVTLLNEFYTLLAKH